MKALLLVFLATLVLFAPQAHCQRTATIWVSKQDFYKEFTIDATAVPGLYSSVSTLAIPDTCPQPNGARTGRFKVRTFDTEGSQVYGPTDFTDEWWWSNPEGRSRTGVINGNNVSNQSPGTNPYGGPSFFHAYGMHQLTNSGETWSETIFADATVKLRHINPYGDNPGVKISVTASWYRWDNYLFDYVYGGEVPPSSISVAGVAMDCNGCAIIKFAGSAAGIDHTVTPVVAGGYEFYTFNIQAQATIDYHRTRSYHPLFVTDPGHVGRADMFTDYDSCIRDDDPVLGTITVKEGDGVPVGAELFTYNSTALKFPSGYDDGKYYEINNLQDLNYLWSAGFSNVKQVGSIAVANVEFLGYGPPPINFVVTGNPGAKTWLHELGHNLGLGHRTSSSDNLMHNGAGMEINRSERPNVGL